MNTSNTRIKTLCILSWNKLCSLDWACSAEYTASRATHGNNTVWNREPGAAMSQGHHSSHCAITTSSNLCWALLPCQALPKHHSNSGLMEHHTFLYKLLFLSTNPIFPLKPSKSFIDSSPSQVHTKVGALGETGTQYPVLILCIETNIWI